MADAILSLPHYQDADKAREHLEAIRWPDGAVCPHCGSIGQHYQLQGAAHRPGLWKCKDCRQQFSVTVGTIFEDSKVPLHKWLQAVYLMCSSKKGISSKQIERMLGVSYKTAWFMTHRIREAMKEGPSGLLGGGGEPVEVDETYWGKLKGAPDNPRGGWGHKMKVVSLVERGGKKHSVAMTRVTAKTLKPILDAKISKKARLMTDESQVYNKLGQRYAEHGIVNHSAGEYQRGDISTNTVESSFAILKRGLYGTFHHVGEQHL